MARGSRTSESHERAIGGLAELIDAAAVAPDHWNNVCAGFQRFLGDGRVLLQGYDATAPYAMPLAGAGWDDINFEHYFEHYAAINPWVPALSDVPVFRTALSDAVLPRNVLERTEFYNDWIKPMGGADSASGIKVVQESGRFAYFCVHYSGQRADECYEALAPVFRELAPRMRRALDCNRVVLGSQRIVKGGSLMQDLLDPAVIVDVECRVLGTNASAEGLLAHERLLRVRTGDKLVFSDAETQASFVRAVGSVCSRLPGSIGCHEIKLRRDDERISISVLPLTQNLREFAMRGPLGLFAPGTVALVILRMAKDRTGDQIGALRARFELSEQEARIALALRGGGTVADIAARLGMAYETARVHLKSAFAKTGTHKQRELLVLVLEETNRS